MSARECREEKVSERKRDRDNDREQKWRGMKAARAASSFLSYSCKCLGTSGVYAEGKGGTRGGTGRLNLPGEFMTELFKGCLVVLNP